MENKFKFCPPLHFLKGQSSKLKALSSCVGTQAMYEVSWPEYIALCLHLLVPVLAIRTAMEQLLASGFERGVLHGSLHIVRKLHGCFILVKTCRSAHACYHSQASNAGHPGVHNSMPEAHKR